MTAEKPVQDEEKIIHLTILAENRAQLYIVAVNSFDGVYRRQDGRYRSTKPNGNGIGSDSVTATAEEYGGVAQFSHEGKRFYSNVAIPLKQ